MSGIGYRYAKYVVPADGEVRQALYGKFLRVISSDQDRFGMSLDDGPFETIAPAIAFPELDAFETVKIKNQSSTDPLTVEVAVSLTQIMDNRMVLAERVQQASPQQFIALSDLTVGIGATESAAGVLATRNELLLSNLHSTQSVRIRHTNAATAEGTLLLAQATIALACTDEIFVHNPGASAVNIARAYTEWT